MGVIGFFSFIVKKRPDIIMEVIDKQVDCLYFDFNGLIHPCCRGLDNEEKMFKKITDYLDFIVAYVNPSKLVYIAIDGVAPRAKMNQQRMRRFRSVVEKQEIRDIRKKLGLEEEVYWDTNAITPGTSFMNKLIDVVRKHIKKYKQEVIFTDANEPMEGEHKIIRYIDNRMKEKKEETHVIYGLDADLIMLSLSLKNDNIYLIREKSYFGRVDLAKELDEQEFSYLYLKTMKKYLQNMFENKEINRVINDFLILAFFIGNDFIPHIPSLNIKAKGLDTVLHYYKELLYKNSDYLLTDKLEININFLIQLFTELSKHEDKLLQDQRSKLQHIHPRTTGDILQDYLEKRNLIKDKYTQLWDYTEPNYRHKFYEYHFGKNYNIKEIVIEYIRAIKWTLKYYFTGLPTWDWYYPYRESPLIKEILSVLPSIDWDSITLPEDTGPLTPDQQLLAVLPPQSVHLLKEEYRHFMTDEKSMLYDFYPSSFELDLQGKHFLYECHPVLPWVDTARIRKYIK